MKFTAATSSLVLPAITLALCCAGVSSFEILCASSFTNSGTSFCVGIPLECNVQLDPELCIDGEDIIIDGDLEVSLRDSNAGSSEPSFTFLQDNLTLNVIIDYVPMFNLSVIEVTMKLNLTANCSFELIHSSTVRNSQSECLYPLSAAVADFEPAVPATVKGGDLIKFTVQLFANKSSLQKLALSVDCHPALTLVNSSFITDGNIRQNSSFESEDNGSGTGMTSGDGGNLFDVGAETLQSNASKLILSTVEMNQNDTLFANLTFRVQPFVLSQANLYFAIQLFYSVPSHGTNTFIQSLNFFNEYTSAEVTRGNISFSLPYYAEEDHVEFTFPPHVGDPFFIKLPITVPCISTELNVTIEIPEFMSDNFTMFLVNITNVTFNTPQNLLYITELCRYQESNSSLCDISFVNIATDRPIMKEEEMEEDGVDKIYIDFGPVLYNLTSEDDCGSNSSAANCTCENDEIVIILTGMVAPNLQCDIRMQCFICENQTLADNITWEFDYTREVTTFALNLNPAIEFTTVQDDEVYAVNASTPAISLPINSFTGDAGDSYNLTFGVLHNSEYSSFTAYDLNYTFSVDEHLDPEFNITICYSNNSGDPFICEKEPFVNLTVSRCGFHPK